MGQFQGVPGPSQDDFNTLNSNIVQFIPSKLINDDTEKTNRTINMPNNARLFIIGQDSDPNYRFVVLVSTNSSGSPSVTEIIKGNYITFDGTTANKLKITTSTSKGLDYMIFATKASMIANISLT